MGVADYAMLTILWFNYKLREGSFPALHRKQGWLADDTGLNGIRLKCDDGKELKPSEEGPWGKWNPWKNVTEGRKITRVRMRSDRGRHLGDVWP